MKVRLEKYMCPPEEDILFVTRYQGKYTQLSVRAIQNLVEKYSSAFDENVAHISYVIRMLQIIIRKTRT